jgi:FKBP-type peptidyl-prolyl cis-trans isomerase FkpA
MIVCMKRTVSFILFAVIAVALIWLGAWYDNQSTSQSNQQALEQGQAAQQAQQQLMDQLKIKDDVVGTGAVAQSGDTVSVLYTGTLDNGTVFDASSLHGNQPFSFALGAGQVIQGWDLGVVGMKVGGTRELTIPPALAYGANSPAPSIPANSTLHFKVQLLSVSSTPSGQ